MKKILIIVSALFMGVCTKSVGQEKPSTVEYFGLKAPGNKAQLFAEGIVSDALANRDVAIIPDGKEIYWCVSLPGAGINTIMFSKLVDGIWTQPDVVPGLGNGKFTCMEPNISQDGKKMFFYSDMPDPSSGETERGESDIWVMERVGGGWGNPHNLGSPVNSDAPEFFPSVAKTGNIYFSRADPKTRVHYIYKSEYIDGKYNEPEILPDEVNSGRNRFNAFVAPDESYIIVPTVGREDSYGGCDYYISFNLGGGKWTMAENMGPEINSKDAREWSPYVSPDGKYFFFMSARTGTKYKSIDLNFTNIQSLNNQCQNGNSDIYWISADIIAKIKEKVLSK